VGSALVDADAADLLRTWIAKDLRPLRHSDASADSRR
jgi:hypothetical protein